MMIVVILILLMFYVCVFVVGIFDGEIFVIVMQKNFLNIVDVSVFYIVIDVFGVILFKMVIVDDVYVVIGLKGR